MTEAATGKAGHDEPKQTAHKRKSAQQPEQPAHEQDLDYWGVSYFEAKSAKAPKGGSSKLLQQAQQYANDYKAIFKVRTALYTAQLSTNCSPKHSRMHPPGSLQRLCTPPLCRMRLLRISAAPTSSGHLTN